MELTANSAPLLGKERKPNACRSCGAFRYVGGEYLRPSTHFHSCVHYVDHGVLWTTGRGRQRTRSGA